MKDKVLSRAEPGTKYEVNTWTTLHDTEAHGKVETLDEPTELYRGGMFVNTGLSFEAGKEYTVTFDVSRICTEGNAFFKVFLQKDQWNGAEKIELAEPSHVEETLSFTVNSTLWISVEMGEGKNEVIISNFSLKEVETGKYLTGVLDTNEKDRIVDSINYFAQYHNIIIA